MKFHSLFVSSVSACFELENTTPYYAEQEYDVSVNGALAWQGVRTNVFSLFDLKPATEYVVSVGSDTVTFTTQSETACLCARDFGAVGDGETNDTAALQAAINCCPPGGRVRVEAGLYYTGPLAFKSDITFELCEGAHLLGDTDESHYLILPGEVHDPVTGEAMQFSSWEGTPAPCPMSFLSGMYCRNVYIVGKGIVDGNAQNSTWWFNPKERTVNRPRLAFFDHCENVVFHGITGRNSASWNFHPYFTKNVGFYDIVVQAPKDSPNTDGADPESCDGVNFIGVRFSVGDDAIAIKSGKMDMGMRYKTPASNHVIRNCLMEYAHGAVVLGSEMSGGIRGLNISQCLFSHTDRGLRIKTRRGRGKYAVIDGVEFSNIRMDNVLTPVVINMYYFCDPDGKTEYVWSKKPYPVDDGTPYLGSFTFRDIECVDCEWAAAYCYGLPEMPIESVTLENVSFTYKVDAEEGKPAMMSFAETLCKSGLNFRFVKKVTLKNVTMSGQNGDRLITENVEEVIDQ